jgi:hypothetical protein
VQGWAPWSSDPHILFEPPSWHRDALCAEHRELPWTSKPTRAEFAAMTKVCRGCLVAGECARWADTQVDLFGTWAGVWRDDTGSRRCETCGERYRNFCVGCLRRQSRSA